MISARVTVTNRHLLSVYLHLLFPWRVTTLGWVSLSGREKGVRGRMARGTKAGQVEHLGKGNAEEAFLMEAEDPSLAEREKKKKPPRRLNESVWSWGRHNTTGVLSAHRRQSLGEPGLG